MAENVCAIASGDDPSARRSSRPRAFAAREFDDSHIDERVVAISGLPVDHPEAFAIEQNVVGEWIVVAGNRLLRIPDVDLADTREVFRVRVEHTRCKEACSAHVSPLSLPKTLSKRYGE
jgi:hypothetical protein